MRLLSPEEDFHLYTLSKIEGVLEKARYFVSLKEDDGTLHHWGLQRQYGSRQASELLNETSTQQLQTLMQERLITLWQEAQSISQKSSLECELFLKKLRNDLEELGAMRLEGLQYRHLRSVLDALSEIAAHQTPNPDSLRIPQSDR